MALVDERHCVVGQVVEQRGRGLARLPSRQVPRVVLDAVAVADLLDHLDIEHGALVEPLGLEELAFSFELRPVPGELLADGVDGEPRAIAGGDEVGLRKHRHLVVTAQHLASERIDRHQLVDLVTEQLDAQRRVLVRGVHLDDVAPHAETAAPELEIVALVLDFHELPQDLIAVDALPAREREQHAVVGFRRAQAVDARDARDDDDVAPLEERSGGGEPHPVDLVVDRRFLLDVGVARGNVGFWLVVVVVADEVLDGVLGEEALELLVQLSRQRLVVDHHERRPVHARDDLRHRERLAGAGDTEQHLVAIAANEALDELVLRPGLITAQFEIGDQLEMIVDRWHETVAAVGVRPAIGRRVSRWCG